MYVFKLEYPSDRSLLLASDEIALHCKINLNSSGRALIRLDIDINNGPLAP